ncbi:Succinyl-CoA ligase subunit alpha [Mycena kentingensis (nom. inval.)]|nr:Succinyl-CoA ligase subunit alpha [Mycena kentingensis (nom. inval.)]
MIPGRAALVLALCGVRLAAAHMAVYHHGMYCLNGTTPGKDDQDNSDIVLPLFQLTKDDWWFHHFNGCDQFPPDEGDFLELPANGEFTVEIAVNRAFTSLSYGGVRMAEFGDGQNHEEGLGGVDCIGGFQIHTQNETMAAGTAFAISYESDLAAVTPENLVVFTTRYHTPWKRLATYKVPDLPACPPDGCICAWGWVPNGCGEPNMYMQGFRCKVIGQTGSKRVAVPAAPPRFCAPADSTGEGCTTGPRQMIYWNQLDGNNIEGFDAQGRSPAYSDVLGWAEGAQTDIFEGSASGGVPPTSVQGSGPAASGVPASGGGVQNLAIGSHTRVIFQGFTGKQATANAVESLVWGTRIVGGVTPGKRGVHHAPQLAHLPVFPNVREAVEVLKPDATGIYVAASQAAAAIEEALEAEIPLIVAVAEHIPLSEILKIHSMLATQSKCRLVGANAPGIISAIGHCRIGFQPLPCFSPGHVGIIAKSGTLSYEAVAALTRAGLGQSLCIGMGGDVVAGTDFVDGLEILVDDDGTHGIVLIGEIGGRAEEEAAEWIEQYRTTTSNPKPIAGLVAGKIVKPSTVMGHAGAWIARGDGTADEKYRLLDAAGVEMVQHPSDFGRVMSRMLTREPSVTSLGGPRRSYHTYTRGQTRNLHIGGLDAQRRFPALSISPTAPPTPPSPNCQQYILALGVDRSARAPAFFVHRVCRSGTVRLQGHVVYDYRTGLTTETVSDVASYFGLSKPPVPPSLGLRLRQLHDIYVSHEAVELEVLVDVTLTTEDRLPLGVMDDLAGPVRCIVDFHSPSFTFDDAAFRSGGRQVQLHESVAAPTAGTVYVPLVYAANFLDTGGKATSDTVKHAFALLLEDARVRVIFVNVFGGLTLGDMIARGILLAFNDPEIKGKMPERKVRVVVRIRGTNEEEGQQILRESGVEGMSVFDDFGDAARKCVELATEALQADKVNE